MEVYFAYGSNMSARRLGARIASARGVGRARLDDVRLAFNKPGRDGTGKANVVDAAGECAWGVAWQVTRTDLTALDTFEPGYDRVTRRVALDDGRRLPAHVYIWQAATPTLPPLEAYLDHIVRGAAEHALPATYVAELRRTPTRPSVERAAKS